jgi:hypothetical protein
MSIVLEEPALAREFGDRIRPSSFRNELYRKLYERIVANAGEIVTTADVLALFTDDQPSLDALSSVGSRDRSATVRYGDTAERRAHLERVVERIELDAVEERYRDVRQRIDEAFTAGKPISEALRVESEALLSKLQK